jgi:hypothetical protein
LVVNNLGLSLGRLKEYSLMSGFVCPFWTDGFGLNLPFLVFFGIGRVLIEPDDLGGLAVFSFPSWLVAPVILELELCAVEEGDGGSLLSKLEGLTFGEQDVAQVDLLAHPLLPPVDLQRHLHVHLLALEGLRLGVEGQRGEQAEHLGEADSFLRVGELDGVGLVHLHCPLAPLRLLRPQPEDGDLQLQHLLVLHLQRQRLEVQRHRLIGYTHMFI